MKTQTDDELLTHYILFQGGDPEQDEVRKLWKDTHGYKAYVLRVRFEELGQSINEALKKLLPHN